MTDQANVENAGPEHHGRLGVGGAVALAVRRHRVNAGLAIRELGRISGVSSAMISRIENDQVSPSLSTLEALAEALSVPVISFFQHTLQTADISFVKSGEGLTAKRIAPGHEHDYRVLANFSDNALKFSAARVSLNRSDNGTHPSYIAHGYVFITVVSGACTYYCGASEFEMEGDDCLSFDAQLRHGVRTVKSKEVTFVSVAAYPT